MLFYFLVLECGWLSLQSIDLGRIQLSKKLHVVDSSGLPRWISGKKNPPAKQEMQIRSLGQEDPLEEGMATHSSSLARKIPWTESLVGYGSWGHKKSDATEMTDIQKLTQHCKATILK